MKVVSAFAAAVAALLGAARAADIDNGFTQDGSTTYCMGVTGAVGTLVFDTLEASNAGRCPVGVTLSLTASEFHVNDLVTVKWSAKANAGVSNAIFPNAIDTATKLPGAVTVSSLYACTAGTNCATNVGGTPTGADGTSTGAFATDGTKALETNTFTLPTAGDYVIVGLVALPGDTSLSLSADEYVVFKKISVVSTDTVISSSTNSTTGSSDKGSSAGHSNSKSNSNSNSLSSAHSGASGSSADQSNKSGKDDDNSKSSASTESAKQGTSTSTPTTSDDTTQQTDTGSSGAAKSASTSSSSDGFLGGNGMIIVAALVACCIVGVVGFAFVMRRRKEQRTHANKAFDLQSPSMSSDMDDSSLNNGGKIDLTYVANISSRNNNAAAENMMSEESSVAIMSSAERGSELNSSNGSSLHSLPKSSLDTDAYSEKVSYGAVGAAAHQNESEIDAYRMSNMSDVSSIAGGAQSEASMSNFGDSVVSARQNQYLQNEWNDSESSRMDSRLDSMEQAELKARGFGSISGFSTVSGLSEDNTRITGLSEHDSNHDIGFSMSSRPTVESRYTEDYRETEDAPVVDDSRFTEDYRATVESHVTEDSRATGFSEAMDDSRMQSEVSVDSYGFRASRESADSYTSGMSPYSREDSRISGFSVGSDRSSTY
ncbi:hypothetical protein PR003_g5334 [Phytophthora rubi]|uniref:Uncharacterized protein n=1 Tax=Phytophthora rubi TaxID=129364 RepID=A0A6A4FQE9_9STRA|nr:hypothetical protein PR002_g5282 [Phytophthora rubi]KAE9044721.1 hypothetical protein PR001_g5251 [Phytophthora rubi]KAE9350509.1 hypothetical protein PR003_g5334 [Phytophthora rubi]